MYSTIHLRIRLKGLLIHLTGHVHGRKKTDQTKETEKGRKNKKGCVVLFSAYRGNSGNTIRNTYVSRTVTTV